MPLSHDVLSRLASLSGYDQMLEMDTISRNHGVSLAQIETELASFNAGAQPESTPSTSEIDTFVPGAYKEDVDLSSAQPINTGPQFIDNPDQFRMRYNPSHEGLAHQAQVNQAIICPACSSPLGIPEIRPIKVTCPQCMHEAVFQS